MIFAGGDFDRQQRSMDAINTAFTTLNQTPIYRERLVILCDKPNEKRKADFEKFTNGYPHLQKNSQLVVAPVCALEEAYPAKWIKSAEEVAKLSPHDKTKLAAEVGDSITQDQFEKEMQHVFQSLQVAWEKAHK